MDKKKKIIIGVAVAVIVVIIIAVTFVLTLDKGGDNDTVMSREVKNIEELKVAIGNRLIIPKNVEDSTISILYNTAVTKEYVSSVSGYDKMAHGYKITLKMNGQNYDIIATIDSSAMSTLELLDKSKYDEKSLSESGIATNYYISKSENTTYFVSGDGAYMIKGNKDNENLKKIVALFFI